MSEHEDKREWGLEYPFWIDTDGYSDRDRAMFVAGFEFALIAEKVSQQISVSRLIHRENESRIRMLCAKFGMRCKITPHADCDTWSDVDIQPAF